jgi:glutaminyl-tRNA synthetase
VQNKVVNGWDDPRMPTISGMRRRGYTPEAINDFCSRVGVSKTNGTTEIQLLEYCMRNDLNQRAKRVMGVLRPLKLVIENYPEGQVEMMQAVNNPEDERAGTRQVPFSRELYIEQDDCRETPPKQFYRLFPGNEVRLRYGYFVKCTGVVKNAAGEVTEVRATYDPASRGGNSPDGRKVKSTIHWVSAAHAVNVEARLYENLFLTEDPSDVPEGADWTVNLNPASVEVVEAKLEPSIAGAAPGTKYQFERLAYFTVDKDSTPARVIVNRTVTLKDAWAKIEQKATKK